MRKATATLECRLPVALEAVADGNRAAMLALELLPHQRDFVASNAKPLEEA